MDIKHERYNYTGLCSVGIKQIEFGSFSNEWEIIKEYPFPGLEKIRYYKRKAWRPFSLNQWVFTIYMSRQEQEIMDELASLYLEFTDESLRKTFNKHPYVYKAFYDETSPIRALSLRKDKGFSVDEAYLCLNIESNELSLEEERDATLRIMEFFSGFLKNLSSIRNFGYPLDFLVLSDYGKDKINFEIKKLQGQINAKKNKQNQTPSNTNNSNIGKYIAIAGVLGLKFAAKSIGAELDLPLPMDNSDISDSNVDLDLNVEGDDGYTPEVYANLEGQYNVSFGSNIDSLERDLKMANNNIDYYSEQLARTDITDTYRKNCKFKLDQAIKKVAELAEKIEKAK